MRRSFLRTIFAIQEKRHDSVRTSFNSITNLHDNKQSTVTVSRRTGQAKLNFVMTVRNGYEDNTNNISALQSTIWTTTVQKYANFIADGTMAQI